MMMIYRLVIILLAVLSTPLQLNAQVYYSNQEASFEIYESDDKYHVTCTLKNAINNSRRLKSAYSRLRNNSIDLVGNFIIFNKLNFDYTDKQSLYGIFVKYSNLFYEADVDNFSKSEWNVQGNKRKLNFYCLKNDYIITHVRLDESFSLSNMLISMFEHNKNMKNACIVNDLGIKISKEIDIERSFLNGDAFLSKDISYLSQVNQGYQLEKSLFDKDSLINSLVDKVIKDNTVLCDYAKMIESKIIFTSAESSKKDNIYKTYSYYISRNNGLWYEIINFAIKNADKSKFIGVENATIFEIIGRYPGVVNLYGLYVGSEGEYYNHALKTFAESRFDETLELLKKEINLNGISANALNLTGSCYRLSKNSKKALPYLILASYIDLNTEYLAGNIYMCLDELKFKKIEKIGEYFLDSQSIDSWSKIEIQKLIK